MADTILGDGGTPPPASPPAPPPPAPPNGGNPPPPASPSDGSNPPPPAPVIPEKYEVKLPDDALLPQEIVSETLAFAKEQKYTNEQAQKLVELRDKDLRDFVQVQQERFNETVKSWAQQARSDPAIIGEKQDQFDVTVQVANSALSKFATPGLRKMLRDTGYGNHPEVIKLFAAIGRAMKEDKFHPPGEPPAPPKPSLEEKFYPTSKT